MNIAFYIDNFENTDKLKSIYSEIGKDKKANYSIFYNKIGPCTIKFPCAMFPAADMWAFEGSLVIDDVKNLVKVNKIVNKINKVFYFDKNTNYKVLDIILNLHYADLIVCSSKASKLEFKRITNKDPDFVTENYKGISELDL